MKPPGTTSALIAAVVAGLCLLATARPSWAVYPLSITVDVDQSGAMPRLDTDLRPISAAHQIPALRWHDAPGHGAGGSLKNSGLHSDFMLIWSTVHLTGLIAAYRQTQDTWGESRGQFHFKHDWSGDGMALSDETSHLFAAFHLHRLLNTGYQWTGLSASRARWMASVEAWLLMFSVEYPIDAYNPSQGFGASDVLFNTVGVAAAHLRSMQGDPRWDIKISVKPSFFEGQSRIVAQDNKHYGDYIYWLTYRPWTSRDNPLVAGLGYSIDSYAGGRPLKQIHVGIGTTIDLLGGMIHESVGRVLRPLSPIYLNLNTKVTWR